MRVNFPGLGEAVFDNQFAFVGLNEHSRFSRRGDSGAIIVEGGNLAVGLLFSTTEGFDLTFGTPFQRVLDGLTLGV
jgi:hypothetical protein